MYVPQGMGYEPLQHNPINRDLAKNTRHISDVDYAVLDFEKREPEQFKAGRENQRNSKLADNKVVYSIIDHQATEERRKLVKMFDADREEEGRRREEEKRKKPEKESQSRRTGTIIIIYPLLRMGVALPYNIYNI